MQATTKHAPVTARLGRLASPLDSGRRFGSSSLPPAPPPVQNSTAASPTVTDCRQCHCVPQKCQICSNDYRAEMLLVLAKGAKHSRVKQSTSGKKNSCAEAATRTEGLVRMEAAEEWSSSSGEGLSNSEACLEDSKDEELFYEMGSLSKLQFRKDVSKACWIDEMGMAELLERKGSLFNSMGIIRNGKIYCSTEETLFLAEIGALLLVDENHTTISLKDIYKKVAEGKNGCCWEGFKIYRHLKSLGYIVGRHGIPWSLKSVQSSLMRHEDTFDENSSSKTALDRSTIVPLLKDLHLTEVKPTFELYLPNSRFRKTSPGDPSFVVYLAGGHPPSRLEIEVLEKQCKGIPLKVGHIDHGRVSFFSFDKAELPVLP